MGFNLQFRFLALLSLLSACSDRKNEVRIVPHCDGKTDTIVIYRQLGENGELTELTESGYRDSAKKITRLYDNGKVKEIRFIIKGKVFGDNEIYFRNGNLQQYQFLTDSAHSTFVTKYDEVGRNVEQKGSPLAYRIIGSNKKNDTLDIKCVFADKIFSSISSEVSTNGIVYSAIKFEECDEEFLFNRVYRHIQNISSTDNVTVFFRTSTVDLYTRKKKIFYDTLSLSKKW